LMEIEESHVKGLPAASAEGPSDWKKTVQKHCEAPTICTGPPRIGTDITQIKKIRQRKFTKPNSLHVEETKFVQGKLAGRSVVRAQHTAHHGGLPQTRAPLH
jgi:hypothetical protein